jgi:integrase
VIQKQMGHANISETFDTYGHVMPGGEDEALARVDAYMAGGERPALRVVGE